VAACRAFRPPGTQTDRHSGKPRDRLPGIRDKMSAAKDLLDRGGFGKVDRVDVNSSGGGVFILPAKEGKNE